MGMDNQTKKKLNKAIDKMQGLKTFAVTEYTTDITVYTVKATDEESAISMVEHKKDGYDDCVDYQNSPSEYEVEEVD